MSLSRSGTTKHLKLHRLVLKAFAGDPQPGQEARHRDDDPYNNRLDNLVWGTRSENMRDQVRNGKHSNANKVQCPQGHPYDEANTYIDKKGSRVCRKCRVAAVAQTRKKIRARKASNPAHAVRAFRVGAGVPNVTDMRSELQDEVWIQAEGFPQYEVSSYGRIRNARTLLVLKQQQQDRYNKVTLYRDLTPFNVRTHQLVMESFVGPCPIGEEVRHLNGVQTDNRTSNLSYGTHSDNMKDKISHGTNHQVNKTHCPQGHPYDEENTAREAWGRICKTCRRRRQAEYRRRRQAQRESVQSGVRGS